MLEILENLETMGIRFPVAMLLTIGASMVIVGFTVWFGGLRKAKPLVYFTGLTLIGLAAMVISNNNKIIASLVGICALIMALRSANIFIGFTFTLLVALLSFIICINFVIDSDPYFIQYPIIKEIHRYCMSDVKEILSNWRKNICSRLYNATIATTPIHWTATAAGLILATLSSVFLPKCTAHICTSLIGTFLLIFGSIMILWTLSIRPFAYILSSNKLQPAAAFFIIFSAGIGCQLLFGREKKEVPPEELNKITPIDKPVSQSNNWRSN